MEAKRQRILEGKTAWITGASRGIGRAVATILAEAGAEVVLGARSEESLRQAAEVIASAGGKAHAVALDVASWASAEAFAARALELAGPPAILVNNAGLGIFREVDAMAVEDFDRQIDINLKGPWYMARLAIPHMKRLGGGDIVNIGSIAGTAAFKRGSAYCAAKAGLRAMTEALMHDLREHSIRTTLIAPGSVETGFHRVALPSGHHNDQSWMLEPETIAEAVLHALSAPAGTLVSSYEIRPLGTGK